MREFFNNLAEGWVSDPAQHDARARIIEMAGFPEGARLADIGTGRGVMIPYLLSANPESIIAIDISDKMIALAGQEHTDPRVTFLCQDVLESELKDLDGALVVTAYPHFLDKKAFAEKLAASLRPGACLVIAHSMGRESVNHMHSGPSASTLSSILGDAQTEAAEFSPFFTLESFEDNDASYFLKLIRN
jgi:demethylmenaquinone methyltransferase/2-methoxy-6-polyprenyl-1,4-benzoquinol methylase